jgi:hypothetical protein
MVSGGRDSGSGERARIVGATGSSVSCNSRLWVALGIELCRSAIQTDEPTSIGEALFHASP